METRFEFRAVAEKTNSFVYGDLVTEGKHGDGSVLHILPEEANSYNDDELVFVNPDTVGIWLGFKDINGNKVYSNSTIKCKSPNDGTEFITKILWTLTGGIGFEDRGLAMDMVLYDYNMPDDIEIYE